MNDLDYITVDGERVHCGFVPIYGFDNIYCVNPYGDVVSPSHVDKHGHFRKAKLLRHKRRGKGYECVGLMKNGKQVNVSVHRLVASSFIPNPFNLPQVNHIDGCKENNHVSNLEWVSASENILHAFRTELIIPARCDGMHNNMAKLTNDDVAAIRCSHLSAKDAANKYHVSESTIYKIRSGARWKSEKVVNSMKPSKNVVSEYLPLIERKDGENDG